MFFFFPRKNVWIMYNLLELCRIYVNILVKKKLEPKNCTNKNQYTIKLRKSITIGLFLINWDNNSYNLSYLINIP